MNPLPSFVTALIAASAGLALAAQAAAPPPTNVKPGRTSYKWVDAQGVTHYGDGLPPDAGETDTTVLNRNAIAVREMPAYRPKQGGDPVMSEAAAAKQRQYDRFLLTTYTSMRDIEQLRDERVSQISAQVTATQGYIATIAQRLQTLRLRAANFKPYSASAAARKMPDPLVAELVQAIDEDRSQRDFLTTRQEEIKTTQAKFQADLERYKQITGK
jgi:hypothetical protein